MAPVSCRHCGFVAAVLGLAIQTPGEAAPAARASEVIVTVAGRSLRAQALSATLLRIEEVTTTTRSGGLPFIP